MAVASTTRAARSPPSHPLPHRPPSVRAIFLNERIHFARFPFSRTDCACVQSRPRDEWPRKVIAALRITINVYLSIWRLCFRRMTSAADSVTLRRDNLNKMMTGGGGGKEDKKERANKTLSIYPRFSPTPQPDFSRCYLPPLRSADPPSTRDNRTSSINSVLVFKPRINLLSAYWRKKFI